MPHSLDSSPSESTARVDRFRLITLGRLALVRPDGSVETSLGVGGRKLAFLAYIALADHPLTRDHLAEVFWGDRDDDRARHSLREATSHLRRVLGAQSIAPGRATISLSDDAPLDVDLRQLAAAAKAGEHAAVLRVAGGPFLDGVHLTDSRRFDDWLARERASAERLVLAACRAEAERTERTGDVAAWIDVASRWLKISPLQPAAALSLLRAQSAPGTREAIGQALAEYRRLSERLAREYDASPDGEVTRFASSLGERLSAQQAVVIAAAPAARAPEPVSLSVVRRQPRTRRPIVLGASTLLFAAVVVGWRMGGSAVRNGLPVSDSATRPLLAVTSIRSLTADTADAWLESGVSQMLTMALSRAGTEVIAPERVREGVTLAAGDSRGSRRMDAAAVAARLGATLQVSGGISHGAGQYVLDLTLRATSDGTRPRAQFSVTGPDLVSIVDQATARLATALDAPVVGPKLEDVETRSVVAYRAFVRGLERRAEGRTDDAVAAFDAAIAADSGFVSAVLERLLTTNANTEADGRLRVLARRLRDRAPEFDRLALESLDAFYAGDAQRAELVAQQLVARYPRDPRGYDHLITILSLHGRFRETEALLRRRLALDSLAARSGGAACALCSGYSGLAMARLMAGDLPGGIAASRRAVALQPEHPLAWTALAISLSAAGQFDEAIRAQSRAAELAPNEASYAIARVRRQIEARRYDEADSVIRAWRSGDSSPDLAHASIDLQATLLRERGRYHEAAAMLADLLRREAGVSPMALLLGNTQAALGSGTAAQHTFETMGGAHSPLLSEPRDGFSTFAGEAARAFAWPHALLADALYIAGAADTTRLAAIADSLRDIGARSYYARDWRLFHHVRGLIAMKGARWADAEREFTAAEFTGSGWTRTNLELARAQLAQRRPSDALATLRLAYQASLDGMGRYATRSEMDFLMAQAFAAAGEADSARVYAGFVRGAWKNADPEFSRQLRELPNYAYSPAGSR